MKGAVRLGRLNRLQLPRYIPLKMANRSAENTSQGYVLCCGCRYFHEWLRSKVKTVSDRLRFWELGCEHLYILTVLHAVFGFWSNFCCCCCCCCFFFFCSFTDDFFEVSNRPSHGFLFCKLKISLSKITDLPFCSVPCLKLE